MIDEREREQLVRLSQELRAISETNRQQLKYSRQQQFVSESILRQQLQSAIEGILETLLAEYNIYTQPF